MRFRMFQQQDDLWGIHDEYRNATIVQGLTIGEANAFLRGVNYGSAL